MDPCPKFIGNSDFYGLGIRIGVYLQWISAWITLLLDPESAQATFDANSTFVFAIVIATIIAARKGADAIEMYLMLQFMLGFFVTTLSIVGVRLWLMSPDRLAKFVTTMKGDFPWKPTKAKFTALLKPIQRVAKTIQRLGRHEKPLKKRFSEWTRKPWRPKLSGIKIGPRWEWKSGWLYLIWHLPMELPLKVLSPLKPPGLSWSGVVWRTATAGMIAGYNLAFWFDSDSGAQQPPRRGCGQPYIFLFSKQQIQGSVVVLCRAAAVIIAVFVFPAAVILFLLMLRLFLYACLFLCRDFFSSGSQQTLESSRETLTPLDRVNTLLEERGIPFPNALQGYSPVPLFITSPFGNFTDVLEFFATPKGKAMKFSDVLRVCVSLGTTEEVKVKDAEGRQPPHGGELNVKCHLQLSVQNRLHHQIFCFLWNVCVVLSIAWFIASIELTIRWNHIREVNTIETTGQLIPFVIGVLSALQVVKKLFLLGLTKVFPDWAGVKLEVGDGVDGPAIFKIVKKNGGGDTEEGITGDGDVRDGQTEGVVTAKPTRRCSV
ncbi:hypothetical protein BKA56DRAFT_490409 [Ilyonectria sp. MPI-CAGE-AT-0026]|nr:hypothetical protein BKA56DRAFT_490409 [Ilyonectria sp. MPI-CAGE-AT-0026]